MPTKDGFHTAKEMVLIFLCVAAVAFIIALAGSAIAVNWLVIPVTTFFGACGAYLITRKSTKKTQNRSVAVWGAIGLAAGILWYITA